jgi:hypothetical protein
METLLLKADKIILDTAWMTIFKAYTSSGLDLVLGQMILDMNAFLTLTMIL